METEMAAGIKYGLCSILFYDPAGPCIEKGYIILRMRMAFNKKHTLTGFKTLPTCPRGVPSKFRRATMALFLPLPQNQSKTGKERHDEWNTCLL